MRAGLAAACRRSLTVGGRLGLVVPPPPLSLVVVEEARSLGLGVRLLAGVLRGGAFLDPTPFGLRGISPASLVLTRLESHEEADCPLAARSV